MEKIFSVELKTLEAELEIFLFWPLKLCKFMLFSSEEIC